MPQQFINKLNKVHKKLWEESDDGEIQGEEIKKIIKVEAGYTVLERYWEELHNFNRIEQVPDTQTWIVKKPEKAGIDTNPSSAPQMKQCKIPSDVVEAGEQYGVNFSALLTEAVIEEVSNVEQFVEDYLGGEFNENESKYIFEMMKKNLETRQGDRQKMARRDKRRRKIYKDIFDVENAQEEHIETLRQKSYELADLLQV